MSVDNVEQMTEIVIEFLKKSPKKKVFGNFRIEGNKLVYRSETKENLFLRTEEDRNKLISRVKSGDVVLDSNKDLEKMSLTCHIITKKYDRDVVAQKIDREGNPPIVLGNSSVLKFVGKSVYYGRIKYNHGVSAIQTVMAKTPGIYLVPFSVFSELNLDITQVRVIANGPAENVKRNISNPEKDGSGKIQKFEMVHFAGAVVFEVGNTQILVDIDRREIEFKNWNAFAVILPRKVTSIADAYDSLMPARVKAAIRSGVDVKRIGEWFLIPCKAPKIPKLSETDKALYLCDGMRYGREAEVVNRLLGEKWTKKAVARSAKLRKSLPIPCMLQAGSNTPNDVELGIKVGKDMFVNGKITHRGRQHEPLVLKTWHKAVVNCAHTSYQLTGDLD